MRELRWAGREGRYHALEIRYRNGRWTRMPLAGSDGDAGMSMSMCVAERRWNEFVISIQTVHVTVSTQTVRFRQTRHHSIESRHN